MTHYVASMNDTPEKVQTESQPMPGAFTTSVSLTLHTKPAALFFHGRRGNKRTEAILGIKGFAHSCNKLPDRKAESMVETRLKKHQERLENMDRQHQEALQAHSRLDIVNHESKSPVDVTLEYCPPLVGRAAQLLVLYDEIIRDVNLLYRIAVYDTDEREQRTDLATRHIRRAFHAGFTVLGEVNADQSPNQKALKAQEQKIQVNENKKEEEDANPEDPSESDTT